MSNLISQSRFKDSFRDILLTHLEFLEVVNCMDLNFTKFLKNSTTNNNRKYSAVLSNLVEDYLNDLIGLNEKYIHNVSRVQKKFLDKDQSVKFFDGFYQEVDFINNRIHRVREEPKSVSYTEEGIEFLNRLEQTMAEFFPKNIHQRMD